jgi:ABC-type glutathione transport system ATPase component
VTSRAGPSTGASTLGGSKGESAVVVEHLTKRFGERVAFDDVSFEVGYGEVFGFLGPNGAGKPNIGLQHFFVPHVSCSPPQVLR